MAAQPLIHTLHIQLEPLHFNPPVWRRLLVNGNCTLRKLHHFIQAAFGWHSTHLHEFVQGENRYASLNAFMEDYDAVDDRNVKLHRIFKNNDRLRYIYDFGDSWQHVIALEDTEPCDFTHTWCAVIGGARACPPEDIGGVPGYLHLLEVLQLPVSDQEEEIIDWLGDNFDPELFDLRAANAAVQRVCNNQWG